MILKRTFSTKEQHIKALKWLIIGFSIPSMMSAIVTLQGKGLATEIYYTGLKRYHGVYAAAHDMGHSMALFFMLLSFYYVLKKGEGTEQNYKFTKTEIGFIILVSIPTLYCLYAGLVRTVYVGLFIFFIVYFYKYSKKAFLMFVGASFLAGLIASAFLSAVFFDFVETAEGDRSVERAGSGRGFMWKYNYDIYKNLPLDRQIMGVGIGNKHGNRIPRPGEGKQIINSHNDWLQSYMDLGPIGFMILVGLYLAIFTTILKLPSHERNVFIAFYVAVVAMNFASNSYISRFPLAQMFYMIIVYIELPSANHLEQLKKQKQKPKILMSGRTKLTQPRIISGRPV